MCISEKLLNLSNKWHVKECVDLHYLFKKKIKAKWLKTENIPTIHQQFNKKINCGMLTTTHYALVVYISEPK